ncbi:uncharacterized protein SAPINGB_P005563 [Magnusiomyces paraingens]|uniref:Transcription initiation factor IIF subunit alpha n=1 Tax=Magnusiomyces paraingens TaxID=2606893 RepID=A0A5E8C5L8_9ASCO|nr:uncharacterized protein SAPINGB_P005563 [Saprochaete ingens]VVT57158.1 unnamed protein product [Saprochaete ingens]
MSNPLIQPKRRFARNADPLRRPSRPLIKKPGTGKPIVTKTKPLLNSQPSTSVLASAIAAEPDSSKSSDKTQYREYNLNACNEDDIKDLRYHLMRFHSKSEVDPVGTFTKPIRLHRKDPRNMQNQLTLAELEERNKRLGITTPIPKHLLAEPTATEEKVTGEEPVKTENEESKTSDTANGKDDAKQKGKTPSEEADMSLIAPDGGARRGKSHLFQKKTKQVVLGDTNARKLRYEEYYPWILEDFDGKNTWVGNYEAGQTDAYVLFVFDNDGFKMVPAEKWYKMTPRNKYATLTSEEAEKQMEKGELPNRWVMKYFGNEEDSANKRPTNMRRRFRTTDSSTVDEMRRDDDGNDIDFDEEFADDEEAPIMEGNEDEVKEVENKIKKEHQSAKISALFNENENEEEEEEEDRKVDKQGKHMIKYLRSREKNINYETDDDSNPYATEESSDEEEEIDNPASLGGALKGANGTEVKKEPGTEAAQTEGVTVKTEEGTEGTPAALANGEEKPKKKLKDKKLKEKKKKKNSKKHHDLPHGMVILNLPAAKLAQFQPDLWNPGLKRRRAELSDDEEHGLKHKTKKLKVKDKSNAGGANKGSGTAVQTSVKSANPSVNISTAATAAASNGAAANPSAANGQPTSSGNKPSTSLAVSTPAEGSSSNSSSGSSAVSNGADLITEEEVKQVVRSQRLNAKEILAVFKNRLKRHPENLKLLKLHLKRLVRLHEGYLVLRDNI